jgi:hypothetical protein
MENTISIVDDVAAFIARSNTWKYVYQAVVPPLLGSDNIENTASSIVTCWTMFAELLPGNTLIKFVTI